MKYHTVIPFGTKNKPAPTWGEGERFFDMLPQAFRTGYMHLVQTKVDDQGKEINES